MPAEEEHYLDNSGPLRFAADTGEEPSPLAAAGGRKVAVGIAGLLAVALVGLLIGISTLGGGDEDPQANPVARPTSSAPAGDATPAAAAVRKLAVKDVRIIDPDSQKRDELERRRQDHRRRRGQGLGHRHLHGGQVRQPEEGHGGLDRPRRAAHRQVGAGGALGDRRVRRAPHRHHRTAVQSSSGDKQMVQDYKTRAPSGSRSRTTTAPQ